MADTIGNDSDSLVFPELTSDQPPAFVHDLQLNLDGGQTALIMFMGEKINETGVCGTNNVGRKTTDIVGVGYSELVE